MTQPVSAVSLPLPIGAATEATLGTKLDTLHADVVAAQPRNAPIVADQAGLAKDATLTGSIHADLVAIAQGHQQIWWAASAPPIFWS